MINDTSISPPPKTTDMMMYNSGDEFDMTGGGGASYNS